MLKFNWKGRFPNRGVSADDAWQELEKIREAEGELTAENVLKRGKSKRSKIHPIFEWDDAKAAHQHRLEQARVLMRSIEVTVTTEDGEEAPPIRALTCIEAVEEDERGVYFRTLDDLRTAEDIAKHQLIVWKKKWKNIATVARLVEDVSAAAGI